MPEIAEMPPEVSAGNETEEDPNEVEINKLKQIDWEDDLSDNLFFSWRC